MTREYLQARILGCLQRIGAMVPLAFHGGTALRFLYTIARYSEDLDFTLEQPAQYDFRAYLRAIRSELANEGYAVELKVNDQKVVHNAFIRFGGLLYELGISPHQTEILSIKLEVDTNPPLGAALTTSVIRRFVTLQLQHHDRASLLAGKIHAILQRSYTKGRDIYDLLWYLSDPGWPEPNFALLNSALQQTNWSGDRLGEENWRQILGDRLQTLSWERVVNDVRPFLETDADVRLLTRENLLRLVDSD
jgi:predicted nucleotidyltransferase component of viral defense system